MYTYTYTLISSANRLNNRLNRSKITFAIHSSISLHTLKKGISGTPEHKWIFIVLRQRSTESTDTWNRKEEGLNGVKRVAWNIQKINRVSWKREKINRVSWIIFVQITVLFVEGLNGVKRVAWNIQKINRVSWKREKINRVSWIIFVQITVLFVEGLNGVKRVAWNIQKINRVPCLLHPHWDPQRMDYEIFYLATADQRFCWSQMPAPSGLVSRQMPHYAELTSRQMPGVCPGGDGRSWNWLIHYSVYQTLMSILIKKSHN